MRLTRRSGWKRLQRRRAELAGRVGKPFATALAAALPAPRAAVVDAPLLALDLETTGLDPAIDRIISVGWVAIDRGAIDLSSATCIDVRAESAHTAGAGVGQSAAIHGLRDCDLKTGCDPDSALATLISALAGRVAVMHHAPLDRAFLDRAMRRVAGFGWAWPVIDTLEWDRHRARARHDEAALAATALDAARERFGLAVRQAHDALADALSCAELALALARDSRARLIDVSRLPG